MTGRHLQRDMSNQYLVTIRNKLDTLQEIYETHTSNDEYENFLIAHMKRATECIPTKARGKCRFPWESRIVKKK